jgi:hypothetical protein
LEKWADFPASRFHERDAGSSNTGPLDEDAGCIGVIGVPPGEECWWKVDGDADSNSNQNIPSRILVVDIADHKAITHPPHKGAALPWAS